jgi:hypothetical protein
MKSALYLCLSLLLVGACSPKHSSQATPVGAAKTAVVANPPWPTTAVIPKLQPGPLRNQLDASQISTLSRQGLGGDATSARLLMRLYAEQRDTVLYEKWLQIAAENDDPMAMGIVALGLQKAGGEENCLRAKAWYERDLRLSSLTGEPVSATTVNLQTLAASWEDCIQGGTWDAYSDK